MLGNDKGAAIALVALSMVALISAVALAVDVGMLVTARTEAQRVADLSALAGAGILAVAPNDEGSARAEAINFAARNTIQGDVAVVLPADVAVDLVESTVTVQVIRTENRGTPVGTFFARIFGVNSVNITAIATAIAEPAGPNSEVSCLLPIMLPDRWSETGSNPGPYTYPGASDSFDPEVINPKTKDLDSEDGVWDTYTPPGESGVTGYDSTSIGTQIEIHKGHGGPGGMNPSWYFPWAPLDDADQIVDGGNGAARYRDRFVNCMQATYLPGDFVATEPGLMKGPTSDGFEDLNDLDPEMYWNTTANNGNGCPYRPSTGACDYSTPRIRPVPMFDPTQAPAPGRKQVQIRNFGSVFVEAPPVGGKQPYTGIWLGLLSSDPGDSDDPDDGVKKYIHLIK